MKKLAAFITAVVLILSTCAVGVSATEYGRTTDYSTVTAQGENIYYFGDGAILAFNIVSGKGKTICEAKYAEDICIMGNCLYYTACFHYSYGVDTVYKVDIGSGNQTKIYECPPNVIIDRIITSGNRIYIMLDEEIHPEVPDERYIEVYSSDGEFLERLDLEYWFHEFTDAVNCEACTSEREYFVEYVKNGFKYWYTYNIVRIKSDLTEEKIIISEKIFKDVKKFVYCGEKYIYYTDNNDRLCRYNIETEKYAVLIDGDVDKAYYKNGTVYFMTNGGDLKKYRNGKVSTIKKALDDEQSVVSVYFFNDYILYYDRGGQTYCIIDYSGKELFFVDLTKVKSA